MMKTYHFLERFRVALLLTFISGFNNAYTYTTQGQRFAGNQTGNLIYLGLHLSKQNWAEVLAYGLPILVFILGQFFVYGLQRWSQSHNLPSHKVGIGVMLVLFLVTIILAPVVDSHTTIACLAFFASMQLELFKTVGKVPYANVMMTGNLKNSSYSLIKGLVEHHSQMTKEALQKLGIVASFIFGAFVSYQVTRYIGEYGLWVIVPVLTWLTFRLITEKPS